MASEVAILSRNCLSWRLGVRRAELEYISLNAVRFYEPFLLERSGKKPRWIDNPDPRLKDVQRRINKALLSPLALPGFLHGGVKGHSPYTNASQHLGQCLVVRIDLENFFPSITDRHVYSLWLNRLRCSPPVSGLLTALTTYRRRLPQGAPTSTSLANLVLLDADAEIWEAARRVGCSYTRFVDDLVLSGSHPESLIDGVIESLRKRDFRISRKKLEIMPAGSRQEVTGLSVNSHNKPSVPRHRRDQVRAALHQLKMLPRDAAFDRAVGSIQGRIAHLLRINPGSAEALLRDLEDVVDT